MRQTVMDPLRRRMVPLTPEEGVRQWLIGALESEMAVPRTVMMSEVGMNFADKAWRADIVVYDRDGRPMLVAECKRPGVDLGPETLRQALRYDAVLGVRFLIVSNGHKTLIYRKSPSGFVPMDKAPTYTQMLEYAY